MFLMFCFYNSFLVFVNKRFGVIFNRNVLGKRVIETFLVLFSKLVLDGFGRHVLGSSPPGRSFRPGRRSSKRLVGMVV